MKKHTRMFRGFLKPAFHLLALLSSGSGTVTATAMYNSLSPAENSGNPYGVCSHISRPDEHSIAQNELSLMKAAAINWARTDFDWSGVQPTQSQWDYSRLDETVQWAQDAGVTILPILDYGVSWANPVYEHMDAWLQYVRNTVTRYKDRLRYWEVWNEPNGAGFWYGSPNAEQYATLLEATYNEIKKIDPELTVLIGGFAGIPLDFIQKIYAAGAGNSFNVMNIHPYRGTQRPENGALYEDILALRSLMDKQGDGAKPIWITEIGWTTCCAPQVVGTFLNGVVGNAFRAINSARSDWSPAMLDDARYPDRIKDETAETVRIALAPQSVRTLGLADLHALSPTTTGLLVMPYSEAFPADYFDDIERYVRDGGVAMLWGGVPLYYTRRQTAPDSWQTAVASGSYRQRLHIGFEAYWTRDGVPSWANKTVPGEGWLDKNTFPAITPTAGRFLTNSALKTGDRFIPIANGVGTNYSGAEAAAYAFGSDLKGGLIATSFPGLTSGISLERQGQILPRTELISFQAGIARTFWYELQATEYSPYQSGDHFGILHRDLTAKPAYVAAATLSRARPAGSQVSNDSWRSAVDGLYYPHWTRPDGRKGWALWLAEGSGRYRIALSGRIDEAFDHLGNSRNITVSNGQVELDVSESIVYLIGPENVTLTPANEIQAPVLRIKE